MSRVELFERIRRDRRVDPSVSQRELMKRHGVSRRTVVQALSSALPPPRKPVNGRPRVLAPVEEFIDEMLRSDVTAPKKQRHTIERICQRLAREYDFREASYSAIRDYVARRRPEVTAEVRSGQGVVEGMVPQQHLPGEEAEVDFHDVTVELAGKKVVCYQFTFRLSYSGKAIHRVFASCGQEAFIEGHIEAFAVLGGIPTRHVRYDNLSPAVTKVLLGRSRKETQRWLAFRSHMGFDAFYCQPGSGGAHEKGGVEHEGGRFRRNYLVPPPVVETLAELNKRLARIDATEDIRHVHGRLETIGERFAQEEELLRLVPDEEFEPGTVKTPKVRRDCRIVVMQCYYSVPARFIGRKVRVSLRANELLVFDGRKVIARHQRLARRYDFSDHLDHYLEILAAKPGALAGSTALAQARESGAFTEAHDAFWDAAREARGDAEGTRALIEVLLLHRLMPAEAVVAGLRATLRAGSSTPELVAIEARKAIEAGTVAADAPPPISLPEPVLVEDDPDEDEADDGHRAEVISLHARRLLSAGGHPAPQISVYDQLLSKKKGHSA
ncbi:IS21 family transposase [Glycomyces luteolus]|uniref:IS21 family transposase n=1 Tax=Glycomyces luteolus TaxID=2670330 RepID=UPI0038CBF770